MSKVCYEINPDRLRHHSGYKTLSLEQRAIYRELLDQMWLSESQCSIPYDADIISRQLDIKSQTLISTVEALSTGKSPLLEEHFCFDNGITLVSTDLKGQIDAYRKWEQEEIDRVRERNERNRSASLVERVRQGKQNQELGIGYLEPKDRVINGYQGWLPTNRFEENGQIYFVRQFFFQDLSNQHPSLNIAQELSTMLDWLERHPERRKPLAAMNRFISAWMERATNPQAFQGKEESIMDQLDKELDMMFGASDTDLTAVNE